MRLLHIKLWFLLGTFSGAVKAVYSQSGTVLFSCDFENDLCSMPQDTSDQFDWSRQAGTTGTPDTGPTVDHTTGDTTGHYIYIETSLPRQPGDTARIRTPQLTVTAATCLSFWYHMYGQSTNNLTVATLLSRAPPGAINTIWNMAGDQGNIWRKAEIELTNGIYQVVFQAVRGASYLGDIAIDDIAIASGTCPSQGTVYYCDFEMSSCGVTQPTTDQLDWMRRQAWAQGQYLPGAYVDHTTGTQSGRYMYIGTDATVQTGTSAIMVTPSVTLTDFKCLRFFYYFSGMSGNQLRVSTIDSNNVTSLQWNITESYSYNTGLWREGHVTLETGSLKVAIEGILGPKTYTSVCVDDVSIRPGACVESAPIFSCNFEKDICSMLQDPTDNFDWTRQSGTTRSSYTGPSNDHTKGNSAGFYVYSESSAPRVEGDKTRLLTPNLTISGPSCLSFYYHMYGAHVDNFTIYTKQQSSLVPIFGRNSSQGDRWMLGEASLTKGNYQLAFESTIGSGFLGDVALDDLSVVHGDCSNKLVEFSCDFEGGMCGMSQDNGDVFDWTRHKGRTSSMNTGPANDHTMGTTDGYYMYVETSGGTGKDESTRLLTPTVHSSNYRCLTFWYHMLGKDVDQLVVYTKLGNHHNTVWNISGNQEDVWHRALVTLPQGSFQVVFEGFRGTGYEGDVAIDDISIKEGICQDPDLEYECDFEYGLCGFSQANGTDMFDWTRHSGSTFSPNTGPQVDHTTGTVYGHYMYIEATGRNPGDFARLNSRPFSSWADRCLEFYYHMHGQDVNSLTVYMNYSDGTVVTAFNKTGDQRDSWRKAQVSLPSVANYRSSFKLVFEATRGVSFMGDISIDDIKVKKELCLDPGVEYSCNFDGAYCRLAQDNSQDNFNWIRYSVSTPTAGTGPDSDHTQHGFPGYFLYAEASIQAVGNKARVSTPRLNGTSHRCLDFWYHMKGTQIGSLNIYMQRNTQLSLLWGRNGTQGNDWRHARTTIPGGYYQVTFESVVGGDSGDIAIDDLSIMTGSCVSPGVLYACDFETGWMGMVQDTSEQFNWTRIRGSTPSINTGPSKDHTTNSAYGFYAYAESSTPQHQGDRARLLTPVIAGGPVVLPSSLNNIPVLPTVAPPTHPPIIQPTVAPPTGTRPPIMLPTFPPPVLPTLLPPGQTRCLVFWYHMFGAHVATLYIYRVQHGGSFLITKITGNQGDAWRQGQVTLPLGTYQIAFEASIGTSYMGDIAIDDIEIFPTFCPNPGVSTLGTTPPPTMATNIPGSIPYNCDFETGMCSLMQDPSDDFDWTRRRGNTPSYSTGPSRDHTTGTSLGYYVYIETSAPRQGGDTARLYSPVFNSQPTKCLQFYYHMYGLHIANLTVYIKVSTSLMLMWNAAGSKGNNWNLAQVALPGGSFQVVFEAICGTGILGDIALDDVSIKDGICIPPPTTTPTTTTPRPTTTAVTPSPKTYPKSVILGCGFETGLCGFLPDPKAAMNWTRTHGYTPSYGTGPLNDVTYGTSEGYYIYIETSSSQHPGSAARIITPLLSGSSLKCLKFYYHMYGMSVQNLTVYTVQSNTNTALWGRSGPQGNVWRDAMVNLPGGSYQVMFEATKGNGYNGDIALDEITISTGFCGSEIPGLSSPSTPSTTTTTAKTYTTATPKSPAKSSTTQGYHTPKNPQARVEGQGDNTTAIAVGLTVPFVIILCIAIAVGIYYLRVKGKFRRFENESLPEVTYNRETNGNLSEDKVAFDNPLYGSSAMPSNIMQMYPPDDIHNPDSSA